MTDGILLRGLNDNHRRVLEAGLTYVDELLSRVESIATLGDSAAVFPQVLHDLAPVQSRVVLDHLARLRAGLRQAAARFGVEPSRSPISAAWAIRSALLGASDALYDSRARRLRGYGEITADVGVALDAEIAEIERGVERLVSYLAQGLGRDLAGRLARLDRTPLDLGLLRTLERLVTERGLLEYRGLLESLIEQLESDTFEIAVLGRVSCGKSSLLNAVLETEALPVGVTPVTAVPTRIIWGAEPGATVSFAEAPDRVIPIEELPDLVSEQKNPENRKHITRVVVRVPSPSLRSGVAFVDTPGIGSLATAGARATYAYVPRCDLGVVLVDAGGALAADDLAILRLLYESGIPAMVLLSKADLLTEPDRDRARTYTRESIARALGVDVQVHLVSTRGRESDLGRAWFAAEIVPLMEHARALREASLRRKLGHLAEGVVAAIESMLSARPALDTPPDAERSVVDQEAGRVEARLGKARSRCQDLAATAHDLGPAALEALTARIVDAVSAGSAPDDIGPLLTEELMLAAEAVRAPVRAEILATRDELRASLEAMAAAAGGAAVRLDELQVDLLSEPDVVPPTRASWAPPRIPDWLRHAPWSWRRRVAASVAEQLGTPMAQSLKNLAEPLRRWAERALDRLAEQLAAQAEPLRARVYGPRDRLREGERAILERELTDLRAMVGQAAEAGKP
jgi:GTP-binding protein EngB required for normal cell division